MRSEPDMSLEQAQATVATKTAPRVTKESIEAKIAEVRYIQDGTGTFCIIRMRNLFEAHGYSKPADERNYDAGVGQRYAYEDAFKKLWQLEGYLLCEQLTSSPVIYDTDALDDVEDLRIQPGALMVGVPVGEVERIQREGIQPGDLKLLGDFIPEGEAPQLTPEPGLVPHEEAYPPGLHQYQSHKLVRAAKIVGVRRVPQANDKYKTAPTDGVLGLDGGQEVIVDQDYIDKRVPAGILHNAVGGYYVLYEDDFESWSPAAAFESGYHLEP